MFSRMSPEQTSRVLANQLAGLISALELCKQKGDIAVTVDYSEIYAYASPQKHSLWLEDQIALTYLFEEFVHIRPLYILPPYATEFKDGLQASRIGATYRQRQLLSDSSIIERVTAFLRNSDVISILNKQDKSLTDVDAAKLQELLQSNYLELFSLLSLITRDSFEVMNRICHHQNVKIIGCDPEIPDVSDKQQLLKRAQEQWWPELNLARRNRRYVNYLDAIAFEYLEQLNQVLNPAGKALILITRSGIGNERWPQLEHSSVMRSTDGLESYIHIPKTLHPIAVFAFLMNRQENELGQLDYESTIEALRDILDIQKGFYLSSRGVDFYNKISGDLSQKAQKNLMEIANGFRRIDNLKGALTSRSESSRKTIERLIDRVLTREQSSLAHFRFFANKFQRLVVLIDESKSLQREIESFIEYTVNEVSLRISKLEKFVPYGRIAALEPGPARYMLTSADFKDEHIRRLYESIQKSAAGGRPKGITNCLNELVKLRFPSAREKIEGREWQRGWEAALLLTQLKLSAQEYQDVIEDCNSAMSVGPDNLKGLFAFLKNIALSNINIKEALEASALLVRECGEMHPRFLLQRGYLIWRAVRRQTAGYNIVDAIHVTAQAVEQCKYNEVYRTCYRLGLANLANFSVIAGDIESAVRWLDQLERIKPVSTGRPFVLLHYTRANVWLASLSNVSGEEHLRRERQRKIEEIEEQLALASAEPHSNFADKIYHELERKIETAKV